MILPFQAPSVAGQGTSIEKGDLADVADTGNVVDTGNIIETGNSTNPLRFEETRFDLVREGYLSLKWKTIPKATEYVLLDGKGREYYRGEFPQAFVSGLSNGQHVFDVLAIDADGNLIAKTAESAMVVVEHWPLWQAFILFSVGAVIFVVLISLIAHGSFAVRAERRARLKKASLANDAEASP